MSELGLVVAIGVTPCSKAGHTIRTRAGHCAQCGTHNLAFLRRFDDDGDVNVARSDAIGLTKIGTAQDACARLETLNYFAYGGSTDWDLRFVRHCRRAGRIEFAAQQELYAYGVWRNYTKQREVVRCQELFRCRINVAVAAVESTIKSLAA